MKNKLTKTVSAKRLIATALLGVMTLGSAYSWTLTSGTRGGKEVFILNCSGTNSLGNNQNGIFDNVPSSAAIDNFCPDGAKEIISFPEGNIQQNKEVALSNLGKPIRKVTQKRVLPTRALQLKKR